MGIEAKLELIDQLSASQVAEQIKTILDSDKAFSAVLYIRPNFESETLASQIKSSFSNIQGLIAQVGKKQLERSFPSIENGVSEAISLIFPESVQVKIDSEESFNNLIQDIQNAPKPFVGKVYRVEFPEELTEESHFDLMVNKIETELAKRTFGKHFSALVGNQHASDRRNLASVVNPKVDSIFAA